MSYFNNKRGEIKELQDMLSSIKPELKRDALRKIIAAMTVGKDVSSLFMDVVKNMETTNLELKKLIYLYVINYAKSQPDKAILSINTLRKDSMDKSNPLIRALAVRTMGCIRVEQITEYLCDPLKEAIKDEDPYVRKTAAICVAKLHETHPQLMEESNFVKMLENLLNDGNAMVVSNAVAGLAQISEGKGYNLLQLTPITVQKMMTALNECSEWGQIYILDALSTYTPPDARETESILERVIPRLSHSNPAVVLSSIKIVMKYLDFLTNPELIRAYCRKMTAPLVTLLSAEPEIQYIALRNIHLIIQKRPIVMEKELRVFFCSFNDPIYIKAEKLEVLVRLADAKNIDQILHELREYVNEVDVEFVRKSVRAIGRCAIKLEKAAEKCVQALWECLKTKVAYVVQETIVVIRDIFRKYPKKYEAILRDLCDNLKSLDEPDAKASMIWIIGEYGDTIENAPDLLSIFAETFKDEAPVVQLQILTSCVKLFLTRPQDAFEILQGLLRQATEECENPDLRDRGYIYWRLLSKNPELARKVVMTDKPVISDSSYTLDSTLLDKLIDNLGNLASLYQKPPEAFVKRLRDSQNAREAEDDEEVVAPPPPGFEDSAGANHANQESIIRDNVYNEALKNEIDLLELGDNPAPPKQGNPAPAVVAGGDLLDLGLSAPQPVAAAGGNQVAAILGSVSPNIRIPLTDVLSETDAGVETKTTGLAISAAVQRELDKVYFDIRITNRSPSTHGNFAVKFNANSFKLNPKKIDLGLEPIPPGGANMTRAEVDFSGASDNQPPAMPFRIQVALKTSVDVFIFHVPVSLSIFLVPAAPLSQQAYMEYCARPQLVKTQNALKCPLSRDELVAKFKSNNLNFVMSRTNPAGIEMISFSSQTANEMIITLDTILNPAEGLLQVSYSVPHPSLQPLFFQALGFIINMKNTY
eukprot:TRINITY_DN5143_c0_g1_i8.p1 TRINITY_DN5143_c0_g1~~TRINITY_DN5143_c0_g1_i8.p1  ORF type:complete len:930 (-),score=303.67 TRINITY_DN5143_c0_g1_i8:123-2912(-)